MPRYFRVSFLAGLALLALLVPHSLRAEGDLRKVNHVIIIMQENHSFDNYFGALAFAPGSPYHQPDAHSRNGDGTNGCNKSYHCWVDGLPCRVASAGDFDCANSNPDRKENLVPSFHDTRRCVGPD